MENKKIALVRRNGLGDLLCAIPLALYLKKQGADVTLFVEKRNASLLAFLPPLGDIAILPSRGNKYWNLYKTSRKFRNMFDMAVSAKTEPMKLMNFFLFCLGAKERIAYVDRSWHRLLINQPRVFVAKEAETQHQALKTLRLLRPDLNHIPKEFYPKLWVPEDIKKKYKKPDLKGPVLLISATTTKETSRLEETRYANLLNRLFETNRFSVLITCMKGDEARATSISRNLSADHALVFPRSFEEFMVLLDFSDLYFVGDGGVAHIGAALGKRVVVMFGNSNPKEWAPLGDNVEIFYNPEHVNALNDEEIFLTLVRQLTEVISCKR